jgi:hypothetical protein
MSDDYDVGYGKPPENTQFKPGHSGNSKGRPKGAKNLKTIVQQEAYDTITIKEGGKSSKVAKVVALIKSTMNKGIQGDPKAANTALNLIEKFLPHDDPQAAELAPLTEDELSILHNRVDLLALLEGENDDDDKS